MRNHLAALAILLCLVDLAWAAQCELDPSTIVCGGSAKVKVRNQGASLVCTWTACDPNQDTFDFKWGKAEAEGYSSTASDEYFKTGGAVVSGGSATTFTTSCTGCTGAGTPWPCCAGSSDCGSGPTSCVEQQVEFAANWSTACIRTQNSGSGVFNNWACAHVFEDTSPLSPVITSIKNIAMTDPDPNRGAFITWPGVTSGDTWYASTTGGGSTCDSGSPCTLTFVLGTKADANTRVINVADGTYTGNFTLKSGLNGNADNPIMITGASHCGATITSTNSNPAIAMDRNWWGLKDIKVGNTGGGPGIRLRGNNNKVELPCNGTMSANAQIILAQSDGTGATATDNRIIDPNFSATASGLDHIQIDDAHGTEIRGGVLDGQGGSQHGLLHMHSGPPRANPTWVHGVTFKNATCSAGCIVAYLASMGSIYEYNKFLSTYSGTDDVGGAIDILRSGYLLFWFNTIYASNTTKVAIGLNERARGVGLFGNIVQGYKYAVTSELSKAAGDSTYDARNEYNLYCQQATLTYNFPRAADANIMAARDHNNCVNTASCTSGSPTCQPKLHDPNNLDYSLDAGSTAIDSGPPDALVPVGGGSRKDRGAMEMDANGVAIAWPFTAFQPKYTLSGDPNTIYIAIQYRDVENVMKARYPFANHAGRNLLDRQVQVDTSPNFDSQGGNHPLYDTGFYTPQNLSTLFHMKTAPACGGTTYYVRVRHRNSQFATPPGGWSPTMTFAC